MQREQQRREQQETLASGGQEGLDTQPSAQTEEQTGFSFALKGVTFDSSAIFMTDFILSVIP